MTIRNYVLAFIRDPEAHAVLLQVRGEEPWTSQANGVSGKMQDGESPVDAAARKLAIEHGLVIHPDALTERGVLHTTAGDVYLVTGSSNIYAASTVTKHRRVFYPLNSNWGREPVVANLRWLIPMLFDAGVTGAFEVETK